MGKERYIDIWILGIGTVLALTAGLLLGHGAAFLAAFLALFLAWYMACVHSLRRFFAGSSGAQPRWAIGPFKPMFKRLAVLRARSKKRKRRVSRFIERFREAATAFPDAAVLLDAGDRIEWCNPAATSLLGLSWPAAADVPIRELVPDPLLHAWLDDDQGRSLEFRAPHNAAVMLAAIVKPFGRKHERLLVARNITEVYKVDRVRRDFVANVSHELRTPITVINGFLESLIDDPGLPQSLEKPVGHMHDQARRMISLVEDLLALSRLDLDPISEPEADVHMAELIEEVVAEARLLREFDRHQFHVDVDRALSLSGHALELHSALANLVFNAVRHTRALTDIYVSWQREGDFACLTVRDTGPGIPAHHIPRLTEQFYRVDPGRSKETGGTGLGLSIVKRVLERHDAELIISSPSGRGTTFTCRFPMPQQVDAPEVTVGTSVGDLALRKAGTVD